MTRKITLIPGDGIGPEITAVTLDIIGRLGLDIEWEVVQAGEATLAKQGTPLPDEVLQSIRRNQVALKGPLTTPIGEGFRSVNVTLRQELGLFACVRPCQSYRGLNKRYPQVNLVIIRENTEDLYGGIEFPKGSSSIEKLRAISGNKFPESAAVSFKIISEEATRRIAHFAFKYAQSKNRRKVTVVTKANILKFTDGLFLEIAREVAADYPEIIFEEKLIDNMCMQLVLKPEKYDVLLLPNLYGDIVSDLCAGLIGGLGIAAGANIGKEYAVFEPVHGSAPRYKGLNQANPLAMILSAQMLLEYIGEQESATSLQQAVEKVISEGRISTPDLGGTATTQEFAQVIQEEISHIYN